MLIRWVPSVYRSVAYYANLLPHQLILGPGAGRPRESSRETGQPVLSGLPDRLCSSSCLPSMVFSFPAARQSFVFQGGHRGGSAMARWWGSS